MLLIFMKPHLDTLVHVYILWNPQKWRGKKTPSKMLSMLFILLNRRDHGQTRGTFLRSWSRKHLKTLWWPVVLLLWLLSRDERNSSAWVELCGSITLDKNITVHLYEIIFLCEEWNHLVGQCSVICASITLALLLCFPHELKIKTPETQFSSMSCITRVCV